MAWGEVKVEEQRIKFIQSFLENKYSIAELCRHFEISRKTGYKWIARHQQEGLEGLCSRSKAPLYSPRATCPEIVKEILQVRYQSSDWGPKK